MVTKAVALGRSPPVGAGGAGLVGAQAGAGAGPGGGPVPGSVLGSPIIQRRRSLGEGASVGFEKLGELEELGKRVGRMEGCLEKVLAAVERMEGKMGGEGGKQPAVWEEASAEVRFSEPPNRGRSPLLRGVAEKERMDKPPPLSHLQSGLKVKAGGYEERERRAGSGAERGEEGGRGERGEERWEVGTEEVWKRGLTGGSNGRRTGPMKLSWETEEGAGHGGKSGSWRGKEAGVEADLFLLQSAAPLRKGGLKE
eukprot:2155971-Rhodomonas_salina.1